MLHNIEEDMTFWDILSVPSSRLMKTGIFLFFIKPEDGIERISQNIVLRHVITQKSYSISFIIVKDLDHILNFTYNLYASTVSLHWLAIHSAHHPHCCNVSCLPA